MFKPCAKCKGTGFQIKEATEGENTEEKIPCEACSGSGFAIVHMTNMLNSQLASTIAIQSQTMAEVRKKSFDAFSLLKKHNHD